MDGWLMNEREREDMGVERTPIFYGHMSVCVHKTDWENSGRAE